VIVRLLRVVSVGEWGVVEGSLGLGLKGSLGFGLAMGIDCSLDIGLARGSTFKTKRLGSIYEFKSELIFANPLL
jgi:hypothetical protein